MNQDIRQWIERNYQPWRADPADSALGGPVGSARASQVGEYFRSYFERAGAAVEGRAFEDIMEAELLRIFDQVSKWLTAEERSRVDETVAFGTASTRQPNASATRRPGGYAILLDFSLDPVLFSETELYYAAFARPPLIPPEDFSLAFNRPIVSIFFRKAAYWSTFARDAFPYREHVNSAAWLMGVFLLSHELGHILLGHLEAAPTRHAIVDTTAGAKDVDLLVPAKAQEFEADAFAIELMMRDVEGGVAAPGSDADKVWNSAYGTLGWLFSILRGIEIIAGRLDITIPDTHPSAAERWSRIARLIRSRKAIAPEAIHISRMMDTNAVESAEYGQMPPLGTDQEAKVGLPSMSVVVDWIAAATPAQSREFLEQHQELLSPALTPILYDTAQRLNPVMKEHVAERLRPLLERARAIGIAAAFDERLLADAPPARPVTYDVPSDDLDAAKAAVAAGDTEKLRELRAASPALDALLNLDQTAFDLLGTPTPFAAREFIAQHPVLLHPSADLALRKLLDVQQSPQARRQIEASRGLLARAREIGVERAVHELARFWGLQEVDDATGATT